MSSASARAGSPATAAGCIRRPLRADAASRAAAFRAFRSCRGSCARACPSRVGRRRPVGRIRAPHASSPSGGSPRGTFPGSTGGDAVRHRDLGRAGPHPTRRGAVLRGGGVGGRAAGGDRRPRRAAGVEHGPPGIAPGSVTATPSRPLPRLGPAWGAARRRGRLCCARRHRTRHAPGFAGRPRPGRHGLSTVAHGRRPDRGAGRVSMVQIIEGDGGPNLLQGDQGPTGPRPLDDRIRGLGGADTLSGAAASTPSAVAPASTPPSTRPPAPSSGRPAAGRRPRPRRRVLAQRLRRPRRAVGHRERQRHRRLRRPGPRQRRGQPDRGPRRRRHPPRPRGRRHARRRGRPRWA